MYGNTITSYSNPYILRFQLGSSDTALTRASLACLASAAWPGGWQSQP